MLGTLSSFGNDSKAPAGGANPLHTVVVLRVGAGLVLFLQFALEGGIRAWQYIWQHKPWTFIEELKAAGVPLYEAAGPAVAVLGVAVSLAWMLGFFTRLFSALFLPVLLIALSITGRLHTEAHTTAGWLFVFIAITLILNGSGTISVDGLFRLASRPKKKRSSLF